MTRCNLACKLCCEYVPQHKPFPDMTPEQADQILSAFFNVVNHVNTLHLTGGGEPFLHKDLDALIEVAMKYQSQFDRLMLFSNSTVPVSDKLLSVIKKYSDKIVVQLSRYNVKPDREQNTVDLLSSQGIRCKIEKYYGEDQSFGGWIDFGTWEKRNRTPEHLSNIFKECSITRVMDGNWRTRDGKVHWCTRSMRGMELGYVADQPDEYVDLLDTSTSAQEKRQKFEMIANKPYLSACDQCSGDLAGTDHEVMRYPAAEQMKKS